MQAEDVDGLELSTASSVAGKSPSPDPHSDAGEEEQDGGVLGPLDFGGEAVSPAKFSFSSPMDNLVVRSYQFPVA